MREGRAERAPEERDSEASATPTTGQVEPERSGGETQPGATSPYALSPFPAGSELQRGIGLIPGAASGERMAHHLHRRHLSFRRQPVIGDGAIPFSWRVGARLSNPTWRQRRRSHRHRAERGSAGNRSATQCSLRPRRGRGDAAAMASQLRGRRIAEAFVA